MNMENNVRFYLKKNSKDKLISMKMNSINNKIIQKYTDNHNNNALGVNIGFSKDNKFLKNYNDNSKNSFQPRRLLSTIGSNNCVSNSKTNNKDNNNKDININGVVKNNLKTIHNYPLTLKINYANQHNYNTNDINIFNKNYKKTIDENDLTNRKIHLYTNNTLNNELKIIENNTKIFGKNKNKNQLQIIKNEALNNTQKNYLKENIDFGAPIKEEKETIMVKKPKKNSKFFIINNSLYHSTSNEEKKIDYSLNHFKTIENNGNSVHYSGFSSNKKKSINYSCGKKIMLNIKDCGTKLNSLPNNPNISNNKPFLPKFVSYDYKTIYNKLGYANTNNKKIDEKTIHNESIRKRSYKQLYLRIPSEKKKKMISFNLLNKELYSKNYMLRLLKNKPKKNNGNIYDIFKTKQPQNFINHKIKEFIKNEAKNNNNFCTIIPRETTTTNTTTKIKSINSPVEQQCTKIFDKKVRAHLKIFDNKSPDFISEYAEEIFINLLIEEFQSIRNNLNYDNKILVEYGINPTIRSCLIDSLFGLQDTFKFCDKTLFITVQIFDNYLSININQNNEKKILETDLDIILVASFLIASKTEESFIYHLSDYLTILSEKYNKNHLVTMEYQMLKVLNFDTFQPTSLEFLEILSNIYELDNETKNKCINYLYVSLLDVNLSQISQSFLVFTIIFLVTEKEYKILIDKIESFYKNDKDKDKEGYLNFMRLTSLLKNENAVVETADILKGFMKNVCNSEFISTAKKIGYKKE